MKKNLILLLALGVVAAIAGYSYFNRSTKSYKDTFADFSIVDTAAIDKVIIADTKGKKIILDRVEGKWTLNDSLPARKDLTDVMLRAFHDIVVQSPVPVAAKNNTIKRLASTHKMVQIFQNGSSTPTKIWYVGDPTPDHFGTTALLELPDDGKSPDPYVVELPWHKGFITPMFFADYIEWMATPVFEYPSLDFNKITLKNFRDPKNSFSVEKVNNDYSLKDITNNKYLSGYDSLFVKDYVSNYKAIYYEVRDKYLTKFQSDSMLTSQPIFQITVNGNNGKTDDIKIFLKWEGIRTVDFDNAPQIYDRDRYYALLNNKHVVLIQKYVFDKLLIRLSDFK